MAARFYPQCPICGWTGNVSYNSLKAHYEAEHPEFYEQYRSSNRQFMRVSLALGIIGLGLSGLILIGFMRWLILGWGVVILGWFAYFLLLWQPRFDNVSDRFNDDWRKDGKASVLEQTIQDKSRTRSNSVMCPICKEGPYRLGLGIRYHNRIHHEEYFKWYSGWVLLIRKIGVVVCLVLLGLFSVGLLDSLVSSQFAPLILFVPSISLVVIFATNRSMKQRESRRSRIENHPY